MTLLKKYIFVLRKIFKEKSTIAFEKIELEFLKQYNSKEKTVKNIISELAFKYQEEFGFKKNSFPIEIDNLNEIVDGYSPISFNSIIKKINYGDRGISILIYDNYRIERMFINKKFLEDLELEEGKEYFFENISNEFKRERKNSFNLIFNFESNLKKIDKKKLKIEEKKFNKLIYFNNSEKLEIDEEEKNLKNIIFLNIRENKTIKKDKKKIYFIGEIETNFREKIRFFSWMNLKIKEGSYGDLLGVKISKGKYLDEKIIYFGYYNFFIEKGKKKFLKKKRIFIEEITNEKTNPFINLELEGRIIEIKDIKIIVKCGNCRNFINYCKCKNKKEMKEKILYFDFIDESSILRANVNISKLEEFKLEGNFKKIIGEYVSLSGKLKKYLIKEEQSYFYYFSVEKINKKKINLEDIEKELKEVQKIM